MKKIALTAAAALASIGTAHATAQIGDRVTCAGYYSCSSSEAIVGEGAEFIMSDASGKQLFSVDFGEGLATFHSLATGFGISGAQSFSNLDNPFSELSIVSSTNMSKFGTHRLSLVDGTLNLMSGAIFGNTDAQFALRLGTVAAVPESATWAMLLLGFGLIGGAARYRRRHATVRFV